MSNLSTQHVVSSIKKTPLVKLKNHVYQEFTDFFGDTKSFDLDFSNIQFDKLEKQQNLDRKKISYSESFSKQLHIFFMNGKITSALEEKFSRKFKFKSVDYWIDGKDYFLVPHVDNASIKLSIQIYLGEHQPGTVLFESGKPIKTFRFKNNCGYAMLSNGETFHGLEYPVVQDGRKSIYVRYQ